MRLAELLGLCTIDPKELCRVVQTWRRCPREKIGRVAPGVAETCVRVV